MPQSRHCRPTTSCIVIVRYIHAPGLRLCYRIHVKLILFILEKGRSHAWASSSSSLVSSEEWRPHTGDDRLLVHNMVWSTMRKVIRTQLTVNDNQRHCDNNTESLTLITSIFAPFNRPETDKHNTTDLPKSTVTDKGVSHLRYLSYFVFILPQKTKFIHFKFIKIQN